MVQLLDVLKQRYTIFFLLADLILVFVDAVLLKNSFFLNLKLNKKRIAEAILYKINYLSIPAKAATEDALDLSTKPGPDGMLAPGRSPAPLLYKCNTIIGI